MVHFIQGDTQGHPHATVAEARECEMDEIEASAPWCSYCDGIGHTAISCGMPVV